MGFYFYHCSPKTTPLIRPYFGCTEIASKILVYVNRPAHERPTLLNAHFSLQMWPYKYETTIFGPAQDQ